MRQPLVSWLSSGDARASIPRAMLRAVADSVQTSSDLISCVNRKLSKHCVRVTRGSSVVAPHWGARSFHSVGICRPISLEDRPQTCNQRKRFEISFTRSRTPVLLSFACCLWGSLLFERVGVESRLIIVLLDFLAAAAAPIALQVFREPRESYCWRQPCQFFLGCLDQELHCS
jgi:hypothetical protein